ncbi:(R)-mandelonitrile lyase-like protein [Tanacetum coccineum]
MLQWPTTNYQKPLPPIARRMPGRPPTKRKRDASEGNDRNWNRLSMVGRIIHCKKCGKEGHNRASCDKRSATRTDGATNGSTVNNDGPSAMNDDSNATIAKSRSKDESGSRGGLRRTGGSTSRGGKGVTGTGGGARSKETGDAAMYYSGGSRPIEMGVSFAENDESLMLGNTYGVPVPAWPAQTNPADLVHQAHVEESPNYASRQQNRSQIENESQTHPVQDQVISSKPKAKPKLNIRKPSERNAN